MKHNPILEPMNQVLQNYDDIYSELMMWRKRYCTANRLTDDQTYSFCALHIHEMMDKGPEFWIEVIKKSQEVK